KNISFSYQFSSKSIQKISLQQMRIFLNAQNLFTVTKYEGLDPESLNIEALPPLRIITLGVQASF
ncbi:MAG: hypothetical protein J7497_04295, partial [Chitinophagaceae bacterium]|nr:hypothetical protein [Chitinophagaceae bacterium]